MDNQQWVAMGYIKGAFGVKGWVKVNPDTEYADSLLDYPQWQLRKGNQVLQAEIEAGKVAGGELQIKFAHIDDRDAAALLRGYTVEIERSRFETPEEDEYYWADLVGMQVVNREGVELGAVANLMETGAHDVLVVDGGYGRKLIPFVSQFIDNVDAGSRVITADWGIDY